MDDAHRDAIQSNYASLVEQTDLDLMVSALYEKGVFSNHMIERYKDERYEPRHRKRQLYMDVMTRGPHAFQHLIDALTEAGYWDLARDLDPGSHLHTRNRRPPLASPSNDDFISIRNEKQKTKTIPPLQNKPTAATKLTDPDNNPLPEPKVKTIDLDIKKATKFVEDEDMERGIKVYRMRSRRRGVLLVFSCTEFMDNCEESRPGVEVDDASLKQLFCELGFKVLFYTNSTKEEMKRTLEGLNTVLEGVECLFTVVSSHGYGRAGSYDNDFRCYDNKLMSIYEFLEYFNNHNLKVMRGLPKVFIFQICRGSKMDWKDPSGRYPMPPDVVPDGTVYTDEPRPGAPRRPAPRLHDRVYSDILIAHSTVPGTVSWRDPTDGSWYIQALCAVFAAHAHEAHVEELFTLVDKRLADEPRLGSQTSSVDRWGFNRRLYLHPGLYET